MQISSHLLALGLIILLQANRAQPLSGRQNVAEPLQQDGNLLWACEIVLGSNDGGATDAGQKFKVLVDTGSSDLWLASKECTSEPCLGMRRFDATKSTSLEYSNNRTIKVNYGGDSEVVGVEAKDRLRIAGVTIERQSFLLAKKLSGSVFKSFKFDGVLGLGTKFLAQLKALTPFEQMIKQKLIEEPIFSMHLDPSAYLDNNRLDGELIFGGIHKNYSHLEFKNVSLATNTRWQFRLAKISLKSRFEDFQIDGPPRTLLSVCHQTKRCSALVDSGTPLIRGSITEIRRLNNELGAQETPNGLFVFPNCSMIGDLPNLAFTINKHDDLELEPRDYVLERATVGPDNATTLNCYSGLAIQNANEYSFWILGNMFLAKFHTLFDYANRQVGFVARHDDLALKYAARR